VVVVVVAILFQIDCSCRGSEEDGVRVLALGFKERIALKKVVAQVFEKEIKKGITVI